MKTKKRNQPSSSAEKKNGKRNIHKKTTTKKGMVLLIFAFTMLISANVFAQGRGGGWGPGMQYQKMYNSQTVATIAGEVITVDKITPEKGMSYGVHLMLKTEKETISIHLGPGWFIENQDVMIAAKDRIEVTGSRITFEGKPALIASTIKKGTEVLTLRDANGFPVWSGWRTGQAQ